MLSMVRELSSSMCSGAAVIFLDGGREMLLLSDRHRLAAADVVGVDAGHAVEDAFQELGFRHFQAEHAHGGSLKADVGEDVDQGGGFPDSGPGGKHDHGAGLQAVQGQVQAAVIRRRFL